MFTSFCLEAIAEYMSSVPSRAELPAPPAPPTAAPVEDVTRVRPSAFMKCLKDYSIPIYF